jgi:hypothetical protein
MVTAAKNVFFFFSRPAKNVFEGEEITHSAPGCKNASSVKILVFLGRTTVARGINLLPRNCDCEQQRLCRALSLFLRKLQGTLDHEKARWSIQGKATQQRRDHAGRQQDRTRKKEDFTGEKIGVLQSLGADEKNLKLPFGNDHNSLTGGSQRRRIWRGRIIIEAIVVGSFDQ